MDPVPNFVGKIRGTSDSTWADGTVRIVDGWSARWSALKGGAVDVSVQGDEIVELEDAEGRQRLEIGNWTSDPTYMDWGLDKWREILAGLFSELLGMRKNKSVPFAIVVEIQVSSINFFFLVNFSGNYSERKIACKKEEVMLFVTTEILLLEDMYNVE